MKSKKAIAMAKILIAIFIGIIVFTAGIYCFVYIATDNSLAISDDREQLTFNNIVFDRVTNPQTIHELENAISVHDEVNVKTKYKKRISTVTVVDKYHLIIVRDVFGNEYYQNETGESVLSTIEE